MSISAAPPHLFSPLQLRGLTAPNRLWVAPLCQYSAVDGFVTDWQTVHLGSFAVGRAGLIITEATAVVPEGRITPHDAGIWSDEHAAAWSRVLGFTAEQGVPMVVQLAHAGRKAAARAPHEGTGPGPALQGGWETVAPSAVAFEPLPAPRELTVTEIKQLQQDFVAAAVRAVKVGFAGVELHAAHGYLLHEFLSPLSNHRTDQYGGTFANRSRFLLELTAQVRAALPADYPLFVRLSASDWVPGGWDIAETVQLCRELEALGVDFLDISSGGNDPHQQINIGPGYQLHFARAVREAVQIPVGCVGLITTPQQAQQALQDGTADVVLAGRQFMREPSFALRAAHELGQEISWPRQYRAARW